MTFVRRAVIFVAQILALISIVVATIAGALAGEDWLASTFPMLGAIGPRDRTGRVRSYVASLDAVSAFGVDHNAVETEAVNNQAAHRAVAAAYYQAIAVRLQGAIEFNDWHT